MTALMVVQVNAHSPVNAYYALPLSWIANVLHRA